MSDWSRKRRGTAKIHTHPDTFEQRAVVESPYGVFFNGHRYATVEDAKTAALEIDTHEKHSD